MDELFYEHFYEVVKIRNFDELLILKDDDQLIRVYPTAELKYIVKPLQNGTTRTLYKSGIKIFINHIFNQYLK